MNDEQQEGGGALDLRTAKLDDLRGRDLLPNMMARAKAPKPTWFVKRTGDGMTFACEEREAWDIINNHSRWKRQDFLFIGYSDGKTYKRIVDESLSESKKLEPQIAAMREEMGKYRAAEEKIIISEAVDMDGDPADAVNEANKQKVLRLRKIMEKQDAKLEVVEKQYRDSTADVVKKATEAEKKVAMENWKKQRVWPGAVHIMTPGVSSRERQRILKAMPQA